MNAEKRVPADSGRRVLVTGASGFIGTHLMNHLLALGYKVLNVDIQPPQLTQRTCWREASILNAEGFAAVVREFAPAFVVHLAAYASMEARSLDEFMVNTEGTANVLRAVKMCPAVQRVVVTSSQHVRRPGSGLPAGDTDYVPYEFYGESKVLTEKLTREAGLSCCWTIIRPTAVWGPFQPPLADGVWRVLKRGLYLHPANDPVLRSYGYVKNVVWQIERLLQAPAVQVSGRMFYVGDDNIRQYEWINGFARALTGRNVRTMPLAFIRGLALLGDGLRKVGLRFPIYGSRLHNLTTPNAVPIQPTLDLLGRPPYTLEAGIRETAQWLDQYYRDQASRSSPRPLL
jgi:nucleoside-diphosphate-sugar epimerase